MWNVFSFHCAIFISTSSTCWSSSTFAYLEVGNDSLDSKEVCEIIVLMFFPDWVYNDFTYQLLCATTIVYGPIIQNVLTILWLKHYGILFVRIIQHFRLNKNVYISARTTYFLNQQVLVRPCTHIQIQQWYNLVMKNNFSVFHTENWKLWCHSCLKSYNREYSYSSIVESDISSS